MTSVAVEDAVRGRLGALAVGGLSRFKRPLRSSSYKAFSGGGKDGQAGNKLLIVARTAVGKKLDATSGPIGSGNGC